MHRPLRLSLSALLLCALLPAAAQHLTLRPTRQSPTDLEITGLAPSPAYLAEADLLRLPQSSAIVRNDPDFPNLTLHVTGVPLATLARALHAPPSLDLIDALCTDRYRGHYPADYIAHHNPILVVRIEGRAPSAWAAATHNEDPGPYLIEHAHFVPTFHVLAHADQRQVPSNIIRLNFTTQAATYGPITPPASANEEAKQGFTIAKQNCLRCHAQGSAGGTKSNFTWDMLTAIARANPAGFSRYTLNPHDIDPKAIMPPNPTYDAPTLAALTAYFSSLEPVREPAKENRKP